MGLASLDIHTIMVLLIVGDVTAALVLVAYRGRAWAEGLFWRFVLGKLLQALAWTLLFFRASIPDLLSVQAGNIILLAGFGFECLALGAFRGKEGIQEIAYAAIVVLGGLGLCLFPDSPNLRVAIASLATCAIYLVLAFVTLAPGGRSTLHVAIGSIVLVFCLILLARAASALAVGESFNLFTPALVQTLSFMPLYIFLLVGGMGYMLLLKERDDALLHESEEKYRTVAEQANEAIVIVQDEKIAYCNRGFGLLLGMDLDGILGSRIEDYIWHEDRDIVLASHRGRVEGQAIPRNYDFRLRAKDGRALWISISASAILWGGRPAILALLTDIDTRKRQEKRIEGLLAEKELLLREVNHRVKNNLTIVSSLLYSPMGESQAGGSEEILRDARNRVQIMAQLYGRLNATGASSLVDIRGYLADLLDDIRSVFPQSPEVRVDLEVEELALEVDLATKIGIVTNELVTNCLKYAFGGEETGRGPPLVSLSLRSREGDLVLRVADNGRGLPPGFDPGAGEGFGTKIVAMLAEQLHGTFAIARGEAGGAVAEFRIPRRL